MERRRTWKVALPMQCVASGMSGELSKKPKGNSVRTAQKLLREPRPRVRFGKMREDLCTAMTNCDSVKKTAAVGLRQFPLFHFS